MSPPVSANQLSDLLDAEFSWRRIELSAIRTAFQKASVGDRGALGRAAIVTLYAHWEGFVREAAQLYLHHVSFQKLSFKELKSGMMFAWRPSALGSLNNAGGNPILKMEVLVGLRLILDQKVRREKPEIDTRANLSTGVLAEIDCLIGNVGLTKEVDAGWLDKKLLAKRNTIAHGRTAGVDLDEFTDLLDRTTSWMQGIKARIVNAALLKCHLV